MIDPNISLPAEVVSFIRIFADDDPAQLLVAIETDIQRTVWKMTPAELRELGCWLYASGKLADSAEVLPWTPLPKDVN